MTYLPNFWKLKLLILLRILITVIFPAFIFIQFYKAPKFYDQTDYLFLSVCGIAVLFYLFVTFGVACKIYFSANVLRTPLSITKKVLSFNTEKLKTEVQINESSYSIDKSWLIRLFGLPFWREESFYIVINGGEQNGDILISPFLFPTQDILKVLDSKSKE
jgi:hypothetical protein